MYGIAALVAALAMVAMFVGALWTWALTVTLLGMGWLIASIIVFPLSFVLPIIIGVQFGWGVILPPLLLEYGGMIIGGVAFAIKERYEPQYRALS